MQIGRFFAGIGVLIWDQDSSRYLILKRSEEKDFAAGYWECVTGRVDQGEGFETAARREVLEELGTDVELMEILGTTHFYRGEARPEYELIGIVFLGRLPPGAQIQTSAEHSEHRWAAASEIRAMLTSQSGTEDWLVRVIDRAETLVAVLPQEIFEINLRNGFELDA